MNDLHKNQENGTATIEFAIIFPLLFLLIFYSLLLLFWINDASIATYEAGRLSRLQSVGITLSEEDEVYDELTEIPTLNRFQGGQITSSAETVDSNAVRVTTTVRQQNSLISPWFIRLALLREQEWNEMDHDAQQASVIRWQEPFLGFRGE